MTQNQQEIRSLADSIRHEIRNIERFSTPASHTRKVERRLAALRQTLANLESMFLPVAVVVPVETMWVSAKKSSAVAR